MDHNISCVFLLGFYRGLQKKNWDSIGITDDHRQKEVGILRDSRGFQNILRGILWDSRRTPKYFAWDSMGFYGILWDSVFFW